MIEVKQWSGRLLAIFLLIAVSCAKDRKENNIPTTDFCSLIHKNDTLSLDSQLASVSESMQKKTGVYVLEDGGTSLVSRAWLSEHAEKTIDVQYFIFSTDNVGLIACDYLVRAADRGVKVRVLVDDIMVETDASEVLTLDSHPNISIKIYNPGVNVGKNIFDKLKKLGTDFRGFNQRMHNKAFIVDGKIAITGGRNMADEYFDYDHEYNFRDRDVLLLGKVVSNINSSFDEFWNDSRSVSIRSLVEDPGADSLQATRFDQLHQYACNPENFWPQVRERIKRLPEAFQSIQQTGDLVWLDSVYYVSDKPGKNDGSQKLSGGGITTDSLIKLIRQAKRSIEIQSPYLITTDVGKKLFKETVDRGVKIRILTNSLSSTDNLEAFSGYQRDRSKLLQTGVRIFEFRPDAKERYTVMTGELQQKMNFSPIFGLHAKSMVIDGHITVAGTFNLDPRSANLNTECFAVIYSDAIAKGVLKGMEEELKPENSWETTLQYNPDKEAGVKKRLKTFTKRIVPKKIL